MHGTSHTSQKYDEFDALVFGVFGVDWPPFIASSFFLCFCPSQCVLYDCSPTQFTLQIAQCRSRLTVGPDAGDFEYDDFEYGDLRGFVFHFRFVWVLFEIGLCWYGEKYRLAA